MRWRARAGASFAVLAGAAVMSPAAHAQRTTENVNTQSDDAFGRQVGNEKSGIYTSDDVRGFNPVEAGNARIEGLYYDQVDRLSPRVAEGSSVRVGIAALRYPFPAPTGLIDFGIRKPSSDLSASAELGTGSTNGQGIGGSIELNLPLVGLDLAAFGGFGFREIDRAEGGNSSVRTYGGTAIWRPAKDARVLAFAGRFLFLGDRARPQLFARGTELPPEIERGRDIGQAWAERDTDNVHYGVVAQLPVTGSWRFEGGLFRSRKTADEGFADLLLGVAADGSVANRLIVADHDQFDSALSGEARAVRHWRTGALDHKLTLSVRGRSRDRRFGGSTRLLLGPSTVLVPDPRPEPSYVLAAKNDDRVRQITGGVAYSLASRSGLTMDLGLSKTKYRKALDFSDPALADPVTRDNPILWNAALAYRIGKRVTLYAATTRGLEEALVAPDIASNRSEAPPAIRTRQVEAGARIALTPAISAVVGAFRITKPYFNLDPSLRYRQLGTLTNQGIEVSVAGRVAPGLTVVGGALLADPRISGEAVDSGLIGSSPVGQGKLRGVVNVDWRNRRGEGPLSLDVAIEALSKRTVNTANTLSVPGRSSVNLGARYRFALGATKLLLRPVVTNLFNDYGWQVASSGALTYTQKRAAYVQLIADF